MLVRDQNQNKYFVQLSVLMQSVFLFLAELSIKLADYHMGIVEKSSKILKYLKKLNMITYLNKYKRKVDEFISVCHKLSKLMYVTGHGGNLAWKLEDDLVLITPTQMNKGDITTEDVVFIRLDGQVVEGKNKPTGETPMYVNFFRERPDVSSVIHCHPPATNAFAITKEENYLMRPIFPETITEVGPVPIVPYGEPLTQRLADNFLPFLKKYNAFLMENHGLVIMSPLDINWTMMTTELLEMTSVTLCNALSFGAIKEVSEPDLINLDNIMKTRTLPMFGAPGENKSLLDLFYSETAIEESNKVC
jgi:L-fuculose-phosphate aldolase